MNIEQQRTKKKKTEEKLMAILADAFFLSNSSQMNECVDLRVNYKLIKMNGIASI